MGGFVLENSPRSHDCPLGTTRRSMPNSIAAGSGLRRKWRRCAESHRHPHGFTRASRDGNYFSRRLLFFLRVGAWQIHRASKCPTIGGTPVAITLKRGPQTLRLELKVAATRQQMTVQENSGAALSTESANNASALVLQGKDLRHAGRRSRGSGGRFAGSRGTCGRPWR